MTNHRNLIVGNSGAGKTTMARELCAARGLVHLELDAIAWTEPGMRLPLPDSVAFQQMRDGVRVAQDLLDDPQAVRPETLSLCSHVAGPQPGLSW